MFGRLGEIINAILLIALFLAVIYGLEQLFHVSFGLSYNDIYSSIGEGVTRLAGKVKG